MARKTLVGRFEHLPNRPLSDQARPLLEKVASQVKPIMLKHGYTVGTLAEFFPASPQLLGLNISGGEKILIRLRPAARPDQFYEWEDLIGTMLHELTHNTHGPHDGKFYKLLSELEEEYYDLRRKGYSGDGFHSDGVRVGGSHGVPEHIGKIKGLEAAEKRRQKQALMGRGGRLGGGGSIAGKDRRELAAEAAERRMRDDKQCNHSEGAMEAVKQAAEESVGVDAADLPLPVVVDLSLNAEAGPSRSRSRTRSESPGFEIVAVKKAKPIPAVKPESVNSDMKRAPVGNTPAKPEPDRPTVFKDGSWPCPACTLTNEPSAKRCAVCEEPRPKDLTKGWYCDVCGDGPREFGYWMCLGCGSIRKTG